MKFFLKILVTVAGAVVCWWLSWMIFMWMFWSLIGAVWSE